MPDRRWNLADAEHVVRAHVVSDAELAARVTRRTREVRRLRDTLHAFHTTRETGFAVILSDNLCGLLARLRGQLTCARCGATY